eukprot:7709737-Pyramimonas_sp.AAC.1
MFFAADEGGGRFYKGVVVRVDPVRDADGKEDPWESVVVDWNEGSNTCDRVSPWEMEVDPEEFAKRQVGKSNRRYVRYPVGDGGGLGGVRQAPGGKEQ